MAVKEKRKAGWQDGGVDKAAGRAAGFEEEQDMKSHEEKKPVVLDVRKLIASGVEPYPLIREKVDALAPGQRLELVTPFLPAPLIEKLGSEGFQSRVEVARSEQKWVVHFWKERQP